MTSMRVSFKVCVLVLAWGVGAGCSLTSMETARQLDRGEAVVGGGLDWPGDLRVPRVSAYGKLGVGDRADLGLQGGFAHVSANVGASARFYPTDWLTMSLQSEAMFVGDDAEVNDFATVLVVTPRISTAVNEGDFFYGGVQANVLSGWEYNESRSATRFGLAGTFIGGFVGVEGYIASALSMQTELIVMPLTVTEAGTTFLMAGSVIIPIVQFSVGLNYRFGGEPEPVRRMEPSEAPQMEEPVREPREELEPDPEPEYDEGGVPIY